MDRITIDQLREYEVEMLEFFREMRRVDIALIQATFRLGGPYNEALHAIFRVTGNIQTCVGIMMHGVPLGTAREDKQVILREYIRAEANIVQAFMTINPDGVNPAVYQQTGDEVVKLLMYMIRVSNSD